MERTNLLKICFINLQEPKIIQKKKNCNCIFKSTHGYNFSEINISNTFNKWLMLGDNVIQSDWVKQFFFFVFMNALVFVTPYARVLFYVYFICTRYMIRWSFNRLNWVDDNNLTSIKNLLKKSLNRCEEQDLQKGKKNIELSTLITTKTTRKCCKLLSSRL